MIYALIIKSLYNFRFFFYKNNGFCIIVFASYEFIILIKVYFNSLFKQSWYYIIKYIISNSLFNF